MTTNSNLTDNLNMLPPGNFKVTIDSREFANVQFFCTTANLPTVSSSEVSSGYTHKNAYFPGDTIEYGTFDITFIVDEEMKNYIEMYNWIKEDSGYDDDKIQRSTKILHEEKFKDIILSIQTNKNTINKQIRFSDAFPTSLGDLAFTTQDTAVEYITCTVTFRYNKFEFIR